MDKRNIHEVISIVSGENRVAEEKRKYDKVRKKVFVITPVVFIVCAVILYLYSIGYTGIIPKIILGVAILFTFLSIYG